jgi:hypothetical protein
MSERPRIQIYDAPLIPLGAKPSAPSLPDWRDECPCALCGTLFTRTVYNKRFCSIRCKRRHNDTHRPFGLRMSPRFTWRWCKTCHALYAPTGPRQEYCNQCPPPWTRVKGSKARMRARMRKLGLWR